MSDPYGKNPYGQDAGGQTPGGPANPYGSGGGYNPPPGGGGGYGGPPGGYSGGSDPLPPKTDGLSIAALVLSFLCCLAPVGVILGFFGLSRTKGGKRKGRGLAIAAIVVGILMTLVSGGIIGAAVFFGSKLVTPGNAEVGQCVDVTKEDGGILLYKKDCTEEHDAEIVSVTDVTDDNLDEVKPGMVAYCITAIDEDDRDKVTPYLDDLDAVTEDPDDISVGDHLVCYIQPDDKLDKPIL